MHQLEIKVSNIIDARCNHEVETLSFKILARNTDVQNLGVITTKDAAEKYDCLVVISQENAKQWVAIYILGLLQSTQGT